MIQQQTTNTLADYLSLREKADAILTTAVETKNNSLRAEALLIYAEASALFKTIK